MLIAFPSNLLLNVNYFVMKNVIVIIGLLVAGIFASFAQKDCDTLKWKATNIYYGTFDGYSFKYIGNLDGTVINIDTLSSFYPEIGIMNISNDTFYANDKIEVAFLLTVYVDTDIIGGYSDIMRWNSIGIDVFPNNVIYLVYEKKINLLAITNNLKEQYGIELEQVSYWEIVMSIYSTSKDGKYSERVLYEGADTATFYVVRGNNSIAPITKNYELGVYPNPAKEHFTVTNAENAEIQLYNMLGQKVLQTHSTEENTVINTASLPQGLYVLKVLKDNRSVVRKIQVVK